jgi:hypothetical protein
VIWMVVGFARAREETGLPIVPEWRNVDETPDLLAGDQRTWSSARSTTELKFGRSGAGARHTVEVPIVNSVASDAQRYAWPRRMCGYRKSSEVLVADEDPVIIGSSWARSTLPTRGSSGSTFKCALWASAVRPWGAEFYLNGYPDSEWVQAVRDGLDDWRSFWVAIDQFEIRKHYLTELVRSSPL